MKNTKKLILSALFTAIVAVFSQIVFKLPFGVPITMQTFAVALCGFFLGANYGMLSIIAYILLGAIGVPVFSSFGAGFTVLFGASGGFIFGFIGLVLFCGISDKFKKLPIKLLFALIGLIICHLFGVIQYSIIYHMILWQAFLTVSLPFLIKDIVSLIAAYYLNIALKKRLGHK